MAEIGKSGNISVKNNKADIQSKLRRLSSRAAQASSAARKHSAKSQIEELKLENQALKEKLEQETKAKQQIMDTLQSLATRILEYVDTDELRSHIDSDVNSEADNHNHLSSDVDYSELPASKLLHMFTVLLEDKFGEDSDHMVTRLEELETRVTEQAQDIAEQVLLRMKLQHGLDELEQCKTIHDVQEKIYEMKFSILKCYNVKEDSHLENSDVLDGPEMSKPVQINLDPPSVKLPAETHIRLLHPAVRESIIKDLSHFKVNGADWRMFAHRVGIADVTVNKWQCQRLARPMEEVLNEWSKSKAASVRMLHRHLLSPQLRSRVLAKRVADFYKVD
ncbi:uncharacterized protein LOC135469174 [Liolophura sinensis]|uniref:uncharacterized protein LOC135469174 n=1 Tax=Liolophura sinensis TaxID=3198878 RepID=UPI0031588ABD